MLVRVLGAKAPPIQVDLPVHRLCACLHVRPKA